MRLAVSQHLRALDDGEDELIYHNGDEPPPLWLRWTRPDAVILHTIFLGMRWYVYAAEFERQYRWLADLDCPKLALPQDEYDHSEILEEWLERYGVTDVFSCFGPEQRAILYPHLKGKVDFHETLTGFIDADTAKEASARMVPHPDRPFDIVYRAAQLPYWFGSHGQLKHEIGEIVRDRAAVHGLSTDISTRHEDTIYAGWLDFVMSGRAIIGCESGSSVLDLRGRIQERIRELMAADPDLTFAEVDARMPPGWDAYAFFAISPRHLEAVITKTCQVLVEGSYSGVLEAGRHYISVRDDLADLDDALERLRNREEVTEIVETAYDEIYLNGRYTTAHFADTLREAMGLVGQRGRRVPVSFLRGVGESVEAATVVGPGAMKRAARTSLGRTRRRLRASSERYRVPVPRALADPAARLPRRLRLAAIAARAGATIAVASLANPHIRRVLVQGVRGTERPGIRPLARDLVRLGILMRVRRVEGTAAVPWWVSASWSGDSLILRTESHHYEPRRAAVDYRDVMTSRVIWDHSALGIHVPLWPANPQWGSIIMGPDGRHEFTAMTQLAAQAGEDIIAVLRCAGGSRE